MKNIKIGEITAQLAYPEPHVGYKLKKSYVLPMGIGNAPYFYLSNSFTGIVSTLPNIEKESCLKQLQELESYTNIVSPSTKIIHISIDPIHIWKKTNLTLMHPGLVLRGETSVINSFKKELGVGVVGHSRIAHGLFYFKSGVLHNYLIPDDQLEVPNIPLFVKEMFD